MPADTVAGDKEYVFVGSESSYATPPTIVAADGIRVINCSMRQVPNRIDSPEKQNTRSRITTLTGREHAAFSIETLYRPSGTAGVGPEVDKLLALLGSEAIVADTSVTYSLLNDLTGISAAIYRYMDGLQEVVVGAILQSLNIRCTPSATNFIRLTFSGIGESFGRCGSTTTNGTGTAETALIVDELDQLCENALLEINDVDNSGAGFLVTAMAHATETATIGDAATWGDGDDVVPFLPTPSYGGGNPLHGGSSYLSLDNGSSEVKFIDMNIGVTTGADVNNDESGALVPTAARSAATREVELTLDFLVKKTEVNLYSEARRKVQEDVKIIFADGTAGYDTEINMNQVEFEDGSVEMPVGDLARIQMTGKVLASSGADEFSILHT